MNKKRVTVRTCGKGLCIFQEACLLFFLRSRAIFRKRLCAEAPVL